MLSAGKNVASLLMYERRDNWDTTTKAGMLEADGGKLAGKMAGTTPH